VRKQALPTIHLRYAKLTQSARFERKIKGKRRKISKIHQNHGILEPQERARKGVQPNSPTQEEKPLPQSHQARQLAPAALAFVGDSVFDLHVRSLLAQGLLPASQAGISGSTAAARLHRAAVGQVNAARQAELAQKLLPLLDEAEADIFRRAKNSPLARVPKSASHAQYHLATALEAVCGYLHLSNQPARLQALLQQILSNDSEA